MMEFLCHAYLLYSRKSKTKVSGFIDKCGSNKKHELKGYINEKNINRVIIEDKQIGI